MKRKELMKRLARIAGDRREALTTLSEGGSHTRVHIGRTVTYVPRRSEINELTAKTIIKQVGGRV